MATHEDSVCIEMVMALPDLTMLALAYPTVQNIMVNHFLAVCETGHLQALSGDHVGVHGCTQCALTTGKREKVFELRNARCSPFHYRVRSTEAPLD